MAKIYTISGPRGVGKTSLMNDLHELDGIRPIVPYTTRDPREGEEEGKEYHFVADAEFDSIRKTRGMFDVLTLKGKKYGTPLEEFENAANNPSEEINASRTVNLAASSALELRGEMGAHVVRSVFVLPACWDDIDAQMKADGMGELQIAERRSLEPTDLTMLPSFDQIVINPIDRREEAYTSLLNFIVQTCVR